MNEIMIMNYGLYFIICLVAMIIYEEIQIKQWTEGISILEIIIAIIFFPITIILLFSWGVITLTDYLEEKIKKTKLAKFLIKKRFVNKEDK